MIKRSIIISLIFVLLAGFLCVATAAEEAHHGQSWLDWLWRIINFALLVAVLVWFLGKPMKDYFKKRSELIEKSIKESAEAKAAAESALKEVEEKLRIKDHEIENIIRESRKIGETERDALIEDGKRMSERIRKQAQVNIEYELKKAKEQLKADASLLAIELSEKKLKERLSPDDRLKILEESLKKLEE